MLINKYLLISFLSFFISLNLTGQTEQPADSSDKASASWGVKLMKAEFENEDFYIGCVPFFESATNVFFSGMYLYSNSNLTWGLTDFFFDFGLGAGLRYYPFNNKILSIYGGGELSTFFFNNATTTGRSGADLDFIINDESSVFLGGEVFYRKVYRVAEFIESDHWYITSRGWSVNGGFRARFSIFKDGIKKMPNPI
ncbi:MAG: hypothetical protein JXK07_16425 [Spirochaetes bacterium]|nr:hypothetical protein [Spirochaetota bacterium]MBN2771171.1 hypothetical protein [Spirochaetota bacterium]